MIFFPVTVLICLVLPKKLRYLWLLTASYIFYMCWDAKYVFLLLTATLSSYFSGLLLPVIHKKFLKKLTLTVCMVINLGLLFYFKYFQWLFDAFSRFLSRFNIQLLDRSFDILLPVGISFYIFQSLGYIIDVYKQKKTGRMSMWSFLLITSMDWPLGKMRPCAWWKSWFRRDFWSGMRMAAYT